MVTKFPFGKHKNQAPDNIPTDYLKWALATIRDLHPDLRGDIEGVLWQRQAQRKPARSKRTEVSRCAK